MLASYPIAITKENWLHETLANAIVLTHAALDKGKPVPKWTTLLSKTLSSHQSSQLKLKHGLSSRFAIYQQTVASLSTADRAHILQILQDQNDIAGLTQGSTSIHNLKLNYLNVYDCVHDLFVFAYGLLTDLGVRDRQYSNLFDLLDTKFCPFCGFERLMSPQEARQDQDHYLAKSIYPFAAANMRNLVPMCRCCNRDYKHDIDILLDINKTRCVAFDPYIGHNLKISLVKSIPFQGKKLLPAWWIEFLPSSTESDTWDYVFCIKTRYAREILNLNYDRWLEGFRKHCVPRKYPTSLTDAQILDILKDHYANLLIDPPVGVDFLKPHAFEMLIHHYSIGNSRVIAFIRNSVIGVSSKSST